MPTLSSFSTPALVQDLEQVDPNQQAELNALWNTNVTAFTEQAILGDPWNLLYSSNQTSYYNPLVTDIPAGTGAAPVAWIAFPNRLNQYFGNPNAPFPGETTDPNNPQTNPYNLTQEQIWQLADTGYYIDENGKQQTFQQIPMQLCPEPVWPSTENPTAPTRVFGPYGPRGWHDEYCEWSVTRNEQNQIIRVDFACENPEYWYSLWRINPDVAAQIYQDTLNAGLPAGSPQCITVQKEDLYLYQTDGVTPVPDPSTGNPAYNPLNKWNQGPVSVRGENAAGGVMHLTATPNTLQTELGLAGGASVLRNMGNNDPQALVCCSQYGQQFRHSDPHIGQNVNRAVSLGTIVSLADPPGLYIQMPNFDPYSIPDTFNLPPGASAADCWTIVRGSETLPDPVGGGNFNGNFILHACFQIPQEWLDANPTMTVSDIQINYNGTLTPIQWGSQIVQTLHVALFARPITAPMAPSLDCVLPPPYGVNPPPKSPTPPNLAQPVQMMYTELLYWYNANAVGNVVGQPMTLASNTVIAPAVVFQGQTGLELSLVCLINPVTGTDYPTITVPEGDVTVTVLGVSSLSPLNYAAPGNSYPSPYQVLLLSVDVDANAPPGLRGINLTNPGDPPGETGPGFFNVMAAA